MHCAKNKLPANCAVEVFATNIRLIHWEGGEKKQHSNTRKGKLNCKIKCFEKGRLLKILDELHELCILFCTVTLMLMDFLFWGV
jgi:hypothetical protein